ncbi:hypothetical protein AMK33_03305 [Streptomyces sp. CB02400]|nr:hypothetical protein AMK33_03305 [Streptomyces sp. CB02400]
MYSPPARGQIDPFVLAGEVEAPVALEIAAAHDGTELEDGLGSGEPQRAPEISGRSAIRWRHAPSITPVAIGRPASLDGTVLHKATGTDQGLVVAQELALAA